MWGAGAVKSVLGLSKASPINLVNEGVEVRNNIGFLDAFHNEVCIVDCTHVISYGQSQGI
jgi:hypothetical protein